MNWEKLRRELVGRGYWNEADNDGGAGGGGGGGSDNDGGADDDKNTDKGGSDNDDKGGKKPKASDEEARLLKEVMKRKDQVKSLQSELDKVNQQLKKFEGVDLDKIKALMEEAENAENAKLEAKGEWDRLKAKMAEQHQNEVKSLKDQLTEFQTKLSDKDSVINKLTIGHAFDSSKFIADELTLTPAKARVIYGEYFDVVDGKVMAYDKPRGANGRTPLVDANGDAIAFNEAIKKIVDSDPDRDHLIKSKMKPGAGSDNQPVKKPENKPVLKGASRIAAGLSEQAQKKK